MIQKKEGEKKKKNLRSSGELYCRPSPSPVRLRQLIGTMIQRKGRRKKKKKGLKSSGESCDQTFVPKVLRYGDRDRPLGSPPICSVFSFRKWGFCREIHLGVIYDSSILV